MAQISIVGAEPANMKEGKAVHRFQSSLGALLLHIKSGQGQYIPRFLGVLSLHVLSRAKRERWRGVTPDRASTLARVALERFLDPHCDRCNGVGRIGELGQVIVICSSKEGGCGGTGKKADNWRGWMEYVKDVLGMLDRFEGYAAGGTRKQARGPQPHSI